MGTSPSFIIKYSELFGETIYVVHCCNESRSCLHRSCLYRPQTLNHNDCRYLIKFFRPLGNQQVRISFIGELRPSLSQTNFSLCSPICCWILRFVRHLCCYCFAVFRICYYWHDSMIIPACIRVYQGTSVFHSIIEWTYVVDKSPNQTME